MKLERLISIIMLLNNRGRMNAKELAEKFEVSVKTIRRDMEAINQAGIPIVAYQGQDGGYEIMKDYKLDRSVLTLQESNFIVMLLKGLEQAYPCFEFASLREKFHAVHTVSFACSRLSVDFSGWGSNARTEEKLKLIGQALSKQKVISFQYRNLRGELLKRQAEPIQILFRGAQWYLFAWCRVRQACRLFKIKRMRSLEVTEEFYCMRDVSPDEFSMAPPVLEPLRLRVSEAFLSKIDDYFDSYTREGSMISLDWPADEWAVSFILGLGSDAEVIAPLALREKIKRKLGAMARLYGGAEKD